MTMGENWEVSERWNAPIPGLAMKQDNGTLILSGGNNQMECCISILEMVLEECRHMDMQ